MSLRKQFYYITIFLICNWWNHFIKNIQIPLFFKVAHQKNPNKHYNYNTDKTNQCLKKCFVTIFILYPVIKFYRNFYKWVNDGWPYLSFIILFCNFKSISIIHRSTTSRIIFRFYYYICWNNTVIYV